MKPKIKVKKKNYRIFLKEKPIYIQHDFPTGKQPQDGQQQESIVEAVTGTRQNIQSTEIEAIGDTIVVNQGRQPTINQSSRVTGVSGTENTVVATKIKVVGKTITYK